MPSAKATSGPPHLVVASLPQVAADEHPSVLALRSRFGDSILGLKADPTGTPVVTIEPGRPSIIGRAALASAARL